MSIFRRAHLLKAAILALGLAGGFVMATPQPAQAASSFSFGFSTGDHGYYGGHRRYHRPRHHYRDRYYYAPPPRYYAPPRYYRPYYPPPPPRKYRRRHYRGW